MMSASVSWGLGKKICVVVLVMTRFPCLASSLARVYMVVVLPPAPTMEMRGLVGKSMSWESDVIRTSMLILNTTSIQPMLMIYSGLLQDCLKHGDRNGR